ncbi:MAG: hypothetical protein ABR608_13710 [Pseudonocardiaceae bacterium]
MEHLRQVIFGDIKVCLCGDPYPAIDLIRDIVTSLPPHDDGRWIETAAQVIGSDATAHLVMSMLDEAGVSTHTMLPTGVWLENKGEWLRAAFLAYPDMDYESISDHSSCPHPPDCAPCTDECWVIPSEWPPWPPMG